MQATDPAHRTAKLSLGAIVGSLVLLLALPALGQAEESNPNNYNCVGGLAAGAPEEGSEDQQVAYDFYCNGPITGYQLQTQLPISGSAGSVTVSSLAAGAKPGAQLKDVFSCGGELPGYAVNCVGLAKAGYEYVAGQFAIEKKLCVEPRVDALLTVTNAYLEKGVVTQAISGPFELGRPRGCRPDSFSGGTRLEPKAPVSHKKKSGRHKKKAAKKSAHEALRR